MFKSTIADSIIEVSHKRIESPDKSVYYNHIHKHCEMLLFVSGKADYNIDGVIFRPKPYDMLFIPSATYHYLIPTEDKPYENYVIGIMPEFIKKEHYEKLFSSPLMIGIGDEGALIEFFRRLDFYKANYEEVDFATAARALIEELVVFLYYKKDTMRSVKTTANAHINAVVSFVRENIEKPLDARIIASELHLSESYVQNLFSREMHIGLKRYVMQKKIYAAHADLLRGDSPIEVAARYSFGDYSSFYRLYKKTFADMPKHKGGG